MASWNYSLILTSSSIKQAVERLARNLDRDYHDKDLALVGILSGAAYFLVDLSRKIKTDHSVHFIQASSYHGVDQSEEISIHGLSPKDIEFLKSREIVVVDELYDNGKTLNTIVEYLKTTVGIDSSRIRTCVAFRKEKEVEYPLPNYCGIDHLPNVWAIGYGLDDDGIRRNAKCLWAMPKPEGVPHSKDDVIFTDRAAYQRVFDSFN